MSTSAYLMETAFPLRRSSACRSVVQFSPVASMDIWTHPTLALPSRDGTEQLLPTALVQHAYKASTRPRVMHHLASYQDACEHI